MTNACLAMKKVDRQGVIKLGENGDGLNTLTEALVSLPWDHFSKVTS